MKVYLDNCSYSRPFDDQQQMRIFLETQAKLHIQKLIVEGHLQLTVSYISRYENGNSPYSRNKSTIEKFFENATTYVDINRAKEIEIFAIEIMKYGIKAKDALHIACAVEGKCDFFITTDDEILKKYKNNDIKICSPIEFINLREDYYV
ncbi:MAG: PIN domain-containing protein [Bacteroidales bacterium]|jgi:predicted nucleic acid-binding protein|nr:PIN domain-containing protein [Bacteroidales bacterium]